MTQEEIADRLNISKASVYRCVKILNEKWKIIDRTRVPDSRKWHYSNRENPQVDLIISVILSLLENFRSHQVALNGIISQYNTLDKQIQHSKQGKRFKTVVDEMNQSTKVIGEELTKVVENIQQQYQTM
jgi:DNA-binding transcriptional regulator GbsR (MarR family)